MKAAEQALRDSKIIEVSLACVPEKSYLILISSDSSSSCTYMQELEVAVQLTEGALSMAKKNDDQRASTDLQKTVQTLEQKLREAEKRGEEAESSKVRLMDRLEEMEKRLRQAEDAAAAVMMTTAAAATASTGSSPIGGMGMMMSPASTKVRISEAGGVERGPGLSPHTNAQTCAEVRLLLLRGLD